MYIFVGFLFIYFIILIILGLINRSTYLNKSFYFANYDKNVFSLTSSLTATILGGSATIGLVGLASRQGLPAAWWLLFGTLGLMLLYGFFVRNIYRLRLKTIIDLLKRYESPAVEKIGAFFIVVAWCGVVSGQITAASKLIDAVFKVENHSIMVLIVGGVVLLYTVLGGQKAVISTDKIQLFLIVPSLLVLFFYLLNKTPAVAVDENLYAFPLNNRFGWDKWLDFCFTLVPMYLFGPDIYSKLLCTRSQKKGKKMLIVSSIIIAVFAFIVAYIGIKGFHLTKSLDGETIVFNLIEIYFHPVIAAFVLLGFVSAFLSSADTSLLTASSLFRFHLFSKLSGVKVNFVITAIIAMCSILISVFFQSVIKSLFMAYQLFAAVFFVPLLMALVNSKKKYPSAAPIAAMSGGVVVFLINLYYPVPYYAGVNFVFSLFLFFIFTKKKSASRRNS